MLSRLAAVVVALTLVPPPHAFAQSAADRMAIQALISGQIEAFRRDDARAAFAAASPGIQGKFLTPDVFMGMVAGGYMPLYRPKSFTFGTLAATNAGPMQSVFVVGPDGVAYVALYLVEREPDGSWRIDGVSLERDTQPSI